MVVVPLPRAGKRVVMSATQAYMRVKAQREKGARII